MLKSNPCDGLSLRKKYRKNLHDVEYGNDFFDMTAKSKGNKRKK